MQSNFVFLQNDFSVLYQIGIIAEKYLYTDSNVCLIKLGEKSKRNFYVLFFDLFMI